jgi:hypothetical protein
VPAASPGVIRQEATPEAFVVPLHDSVLFSLKVTLLLAIGVPVVVSVSFADAVNGSLKSCVVAPV